MMDSIVLEEPSSYTSYDGGGGGGGRAIDRHNPIIRDEKRLRQGPIFPSSFTSTITSAAADTDEPHHRYPDAKAEVEGGDPKRKSVVFDDNNGDEYIKACDFISPTSSSRCLLSDKTTFNYPSSEFLHHVLPPWPPSPPPSPPYDDVNSLNGDDDLLSSPPPPKTLSPLPPPPEPLMFHNSRSSTTTKPPPPPPLPSSAQVVVLEVSLHCRGCERKMKKHISKIEGVKSFKIEFAAKKVTVIGDVTPLAVLTSVLKVKNAKLLTPVTISPSPTQTGPGSF